MSRNEELHGVSDVVGRPWRIRQARPSDHVALDRVFRRSSLANEGDRSVLLEHPDALKLDLQPGDGVRVAAVADDLVAFATTRKLDDFVEIVDLFVDPGWMRRGIGRALMEDAAARARTGGARRLEVTANPHSLAFYERQGFVPADVVKTRFGPARRMHRLLR